MSEFIATSCGRIGLRRLLYKLHSVTQPNALDATWQITLYTVDGQGRIVRFPDEASCLRAAKEIADQLSASHSEGSDTP